MALFWTHEELNRMRKTETNEDGFKSEYLQVPIAWNFVYLSMANEA